MDGSDVLDVARDAIGVILLVAGPTMGIALVVGLVIALFQALTQIQEMTLTFVPKIFAIFISLLLFMPMMGDVFQAFMQRLTDRIVNGGI
ncbi:MAG: flagellar biosynthesis protein FliQ [Sphingomonadales bacterium]